MAFNGRINLGIDATLTRALDLTTARDALRYVVDEQMLDGTGDGQAQLMWHDTRTVVASANDDIDLAGVLTDAFGQTITFAKVRALLIRNKSTVATLTVGPAAASGVTGFLGTGEVLPVGAWKLLCCNKSASWTITAGSADKIRITNNSGAVSATYDIVVIGA